MSGAPTPAGSAAPPLARVGLRERPWYREARAIGRVYGRNRPAVVGAVLLLGFGLVAALAPLIAPADPYLPATTREGVFNPPSWDHLAGTDHLGRDVLSRVFFGARIAWQIVLVATGVAVGLGVPLGLLAGYVGGKLDELVIMRFVDAVMALPGLVLILALTGAVGPSITNTMIIIGIVWSPGYARLTRGVVLQIRQEVYVDAARAIGATPARIMGGTCCPTSWRRSWCWPRSRPPASSSSKRGSASSARACRSPRPPGGGWPPRRTRPSSRAAPGRSPGRRSRSSCS